jgi:glycerol-3-phosphate dehydrogenase subunit C
MQVSRPDHPSQELGYGHPAYLDPAALDRELRRVAEVCHQCRRCLPLCGSFPTLFDFVDATDNEVAGLTDAGLERVNELCFHCQQCFNHCPYTPPHEWDVDFPALMRRQQLARVQREGIPLLRRLTTRTDLIGKIGSFLPVLMNFANRNRLARILMEKTLGIHRDWLQPRYSAQTVSRWWRRRAAERPAALARFADPKTSRRVVLFTTCSVEYSDPGVGRAVVEVLERSGIAVQVHYARCCGMPFTDTGDLGAARRNATRNVAELLKFVELGATIVVPGPSCSLMLKHEYPRLLGTEDARRVAASTRDVMEHLYALAREGNLDRAFPAPLGPVAYHAPCHLRAQNVGLRARDLLQLAGAEVTLVDACSGVDGTWGMQARFFAESQKVARKMVRGIEDAGAALVSTDCPLSALRIEQAMGRKPVHPIVLLARAYGIDP